MKGALQNKQIFNKIKEELIYTLILLVISIIAIKIMFFKENFAVILRLALSFFGIFIIPGLALMFYWEDKLSFSERLVVGVGLSAAIIGISSYYLGLTGLNIKHHTYLLPLLLILIGVFIVAKKKTKSTPIS